ncbi:MAG TPA: AraC family transcriptional regulator [Flavilitoribacter sp.]|nr:AraC family transcriptional regulator [Flavilitoribacter sp.]HMQ89585.1 AraC family transcriptional regulator [Flavilitoribacter sp.]
MIAKLHIPAPPLNRFIESFFYYTGFQPGHAVDRFIPDGNVYMIFDLTDRPKYIYDNHTLKEIQSCKRVWFSGFRTEPITIPSGAESEMIVVNFHKGKAFPFLSLPLGEVTNYVVDAELVLKNDILDLRDRLVEAATIDAKFHILEQHLLGDFLNHLQLNPFVDFVISSIENSPHRLSLKLVADKVGYSQKHTIKLFRDHVGVTPKEFLRIVRFQKAVAEIEQGGFVSWTALADDCGYYDQSHFIADFRFFSGFTPVEYLSQRGEFLNYLPI